ncbi:chalcone isomerase family protein [Curvibacter sp. HBC61]|uniref:Chalcone isomerase family protein n=1 Tax=Curvibacter cyanobacteriorum TaxID=3026422 RepID=A0ABT5N2R0_9BURK|nr:chalcone isomerase family protein [Curvibacter sp. HBC61]MDD0840599.1 chalcone isomerase family protein [Curvibacter sp. HBC61]
MTFQRRIFPVTLACLLSLPLLAGAAPQTLQGVTFNDPISVQGQSLQLNGAGVRYKAVFKVYAMGLYLSQPAASTDAVLSAPGAKRISITMLRDIDANELGKLFTRGVEDNAPKGEMSRLVPGLIRMGEVFAELKKLHTGDTFTVDWLPDTGTVLTVRGQVQGAPFREPEFFNALLRIWLGQVPADGKLKDALLGQGRS